MRRLLIIIVVLLALFTVYWFVLRTRSSSNNGPKQAPIALKKHSAIFNSSIDQVMTSYLEVKNAFVDGDTSRVKQGNAAFIASLDKIPLEELKKDTAGIFETAQANLGDIKS